MSLYLVGLSVIANVLPLTFSAQTAHASGPSFTFDYSKILPQDLNDTKKAQFQTFIKDIYNTIQTKLPITANMTPDLKTVYMMYPNQVNSDAGCGVIGPGSTIDGCYLTGTGKLYINSDVFGSQASAQATIAHEMIHSFIKGRDLFSGTPIDSSIQKVAYAEMLTEYFAQQVYPAPDDVGYPKLVSLVPGIINDINAASSGTTDANTFLEHAYFSLSLRNIDTLINPYIQSGTDYLQYLGQYLDARNAAQNTSAQAAQTYLDAVQTRIESSKTGSCIPNSSTAGPPTCSTNPAKVSNFTSTVETDSAASDGTYTIDFAWNTDIATGPGTLKYDTQTTGLRYQGVEGAISAEPGTTTSHSLSLSGFKPGTAYSFKVVQYASDGTTVQGNSDVISTTTPGTAPTGGDTSGSGSSGSGSGSGSSGSGTDSSGSGTGVGGDCLTDPTLIFGCDQIFSGSPTITKTTDTTAVITWSTVDTYQMGDFKIKYDTTSTNLTKSAGLSGTTQATQFTYTLTGLTPGSNYWTKVTYIANGATGAVGTDVVELATTGINPTTGKGANPIGTTGTGTTGSGTATVDPGKPNQDLPNCLQSTSADNHGILIDKTVINAINGSSTFGCYISLVFIQNMSYVMILATMLIIVSGIQYMLSGGSPGELAKAKERVIAIVGGIILFFLIRFLVPIIATGLSL